MKFVKYKITENQVGNQYSKYRKQKFKHEQGDGDVCN